jgi:protein phosphatase-4 regulatory subunit 3
MSRNDCAYLKALLQLFPSAESRGDYGALATLAACIKTILLMNDPSTMELILDDTDIYEQVCATLEYDPDLRNKANHRWFLATKVKFRTVLPMTNIDLINCIHKSFRVTYLRDTLLRPTMDENCLSTLSSFQTFTHSHVVKGVTQGGNESYLCQIMTLLGKELPMIADMEWTALEHPEQGMEPTNEAAAAAAETKNETTCWKQHVAPQDGSLNSRLIRRKGALSFFRELFNMVRISLQQGDKDDFYAAICNMEVELDNEDMETVNLLSLLGNVLSDPSTTVSEKQSVLEIISSICQHDASHIRRHGLDVYGAWKNKGAARDEKIISCPARPNPNTVRQVIFCCGPNDLLASLLFLMAVETDAGLLLQTSEILRIILDTEMLAEHGPLETMGPTTTGMQHLNMQHSLTAPHHAAAGSVGSEQNHFLAMFYEHYVQWLVAPFQYTILHPVKRVPNKALASPDDSLLMKRILDTFMAGVTTSKGGDHFLLRIVPMCAIRSSFAVELLSFCVRAHLHRMKFFLLRSRVLGSVLRLLKPTKMAAAAVVTSGDRCLKLAALRYVSICCSYIIHLFFFRENVLSHLLLSRFLRSILSVKDEFYHRHIIQYNLFAPVFEAFRANPVGDNLVSSAIVEVRGRTNVTGCSCLFRLSRFFLRCATLFIIKTLNR